MLVSRSLRDTYRDGAVPLSYALAPHINSCSTLSAAYLVVGAVEPILDGDIRSRSPRLQGDLDHASRNSGGGGKQADQARCLHHVCRRGENCRAKLPSMIGAGVKSSYGVYCKDSASPNSYVCHLGVAWDKVGLIPQFHSLGLCHTLAADGRTESYGQAGRCHPVHLFPPAGLLDLERNSECNSIKLRAQTRRRGATKRGADKYHCGL
jgi:hypothetical protein